MTPRWSPIPSLCATIILLCVAIMFQALHAERLSKRIDALEARAPERGRR